MRAIALTLSGPLAASFVLFLAPTLAGAGTIVVSSRGDAIEADDYLTLREAIALSDGSLSVAELSALEQAQVTGAVGATIADSITFELWAYNIATSGLQVSDGNTTFEGDFDGDGSIDVVVDAGGAVALVLASPGNTVRGIRFRSTVAGIVLQQAAASHSTIAGCWFDGPAILNDTSSGALTNVDILENVMRPSNPSETAISLVVSSGSISDVLIAENHIDGYELGVTVTAALGTCDVFAIVIFNNTILGAPDPLFSRGLVVASDGGAARTSDVLIASNRMTGHVRGLEINGPGTERVTATENLIFDNDSVPIQINTGANGGILPPTITSVGTTFTGTVDSTIPDGSTVELFYDFDDSCEPEAYRSSTTTSAGAWSITVSTPQFGTVTATVTDPSGNTSAVGCMPNCVPSRTARNNLIAPFNPDVLTCTLPVSPSIWVAEVTHAAGPATLAILHIHSLPSISTGAPAPPPVIYRKLCRGTLFASIVMATDEIPPISAAQRSCSVAIPPGLSCLQFCAQAVTSGSGVIALSNAIDGNL